MRIIGANPEVTDPMEDKIQDFPLEVKIFVVEVKEIRIHTKVNIKMMAIKATITRLIEDSIIPNAEISLKEIVMVNQEEEAVAMAEAIAEVMVMVSPIIKAILITNIISIMFMMMSTRQINVVHHALLQTTFFSSLSLWWDVCESFPGFPTLSEVCACFGE